MAPLQNMLVLLILGTSLVAQSSDDTKPGNYFWGDLGVAVSDFDGGSASTSLSLNLAVDHHLYSIQTHGYVNSFTIFCPGGEPELENYQILYGYIRKRKDTFLYLKAGPALVSYKYATDMIPGNGLMSCNTYIFSTEWRAGLAVEMGAALTYDWFMAQAYASVLFMEEPGPVVHAGIKFGIGDFR